MNIESLRNAVHGTVTTCTDPGYEAIRRGLLWNGRKPDRFPEVIVKAKHAADVQAAVMYAAANGKHVSARGGGHHWSCIALQDGVVVDLSDMNALQIDTGSRIARAQPTVTNAKLAAALGELGLAFPAGHCESVPLSGYLLGGGFGWNAGTWGIACHNVESVDVVLANGSLVCASETQNPDIFWAVRGAGPEFFGIVTDYRIRLFDLPRAIRTSVWTYDIDDIEEVERWMSRTMRIVPRNVEFTAAISSAPPPLADKVSNTVAAVATIFADTEAEAGATLETIMAGAPKNALDVQLGMETPFEVLYQIIAQFFPEGRRYAVDTNWSSDPAGLLTCMAKAVKDAPSTESFALGVVLPPMDGQPLPDAAFSMVGPVFGCTYAIWQEQSQDTANIRWLRETSADVAPISLGHYIGEAALDLAERSSGSFSPAALERLRRLQRKYDPSGLFRRRSPSLMPDLHETAK